MTREEMDAMRDEVCADYVGCACDGRCPAWVPKGNEKCAQNDSLTDEEMGACIMRIKTARAVDMFLAPEKRPDMVNHPKHYGLPGGLEVIDVELATMGREAVMEHCLCTAIEYLLRHKRKNGTEDVKKAHWWLTKYVELEAHKDE